MPSTHVLIYFVYLNYYIYNLDFINSFFIIISNHNFTTNHTDQYLRFANSLSTSYVFQMDMKAVGTFYYENFVSKELVNMIFLMQFLISKSQCVHIINSRPDARQMRCMYEPKKTTLAKITKKKAITLLCVVHYHRSELTFITAGSTNNVIFIIIIRVEFDLNILYNRFRRRPL